MGFEPTNPCGLAVFKTAAIDRSATRPVPTRTLEAAAPPQQATPAATARILFGATGSDVFHPIPPVAWYVLFRVEGPAMVKAEGGVAVRTYGARLTCKQAVQTQEYRHAFAPSVRR